MGLLGTGGESRNLTGPHYHVLLGTEAPTGSQGTNTEPKPSPMVPQPGSGGQHGKGESSSALHGTPGHCQQQPLSTGAWLMPAAPGGKQHCHVWGLPGVSTALGTGAQLRGWLRRQIGRSRHRKKKKRGCRWVRMQRPYLELWQEPFALRAGSFPSFHPLLSHDQPRSAAPPHARAASLLKSAANKPGRWLE